MEGATLAALRPRNRRSLRGRYLFFGLWLPVQNGAALMPEEYLMLLTGRTIMFDLLLRTLYAERAENEPDPQKFITDVINGIIGSMSRVETGPRSEAERQAWQAAEADLRTFANHVILRLRGQSP